MNFGDELKVLIHETKCLDKMGLEVPEIALNVALQDQNFRSCIEDLNSMLQQYHQANTPVLRQTKSQS